MYDFSYHYLHLKSTTKKGQKWIYGKICRNRRIFRKINKFYTK